MATRRLSTRHYPVDARERLGIAHRRARQAAGFKYRPAYAQAAKVNKRSILSLEKGEPVGEYILEAVGRFLPTWTEDTPQVILEGGPIPPNEPPDSRNLVRLAINALADIEVHGADASTYNQHLDKWAAALSVDDADVDIEYVRREAHRIAAERLAKRRANST